MSLIGSKLFCLADMDGCFHAKDEASEERTTGRLLKALARWDRG